MDFNQLKIFITVADKKSISLAAKELECAQPNVTLRIKQLEKNLNTTLFHRVPKGVVLTNEGERFYPKAIEIVHKMENAIDFMSNDSDLTHLKIGSTECNAIVRMSPFLIELHKNFPSTHLELFTGTTRDIVELLNDYKVDIGFISGEPKNDKFRVIKRIEEDIVLIEPNKQNVPNVILTFKTGCMYEEFLKRFCMENNLYIEKSLSLGNIETILACVKVGMGKSLLPISLIKKLGFDNDEDIKITRLDKKVAYIPTCLVCRKDYNLPIERFLKQMNL